MESTDYELRLQQEEEARAAVDAHDWSAYELSDIPAHDDDRDSFVHQEELDDALANFSPVSDRKASPNLYRQDDGEMSPFCLDDDADFSSLSSLSPPSPPPKEVSTSTRKRRLDTITVLNEVVRVLRQRKETAAEVEQLESRLTRMRNA